MLNLDQSINETNDSENLKKSEFWQLRSETPKNSKFGVKNKLWKTPSDIVEKSTLKTKNQQDPAWHAKRKGSRNVKFWRQQQPKTIKNPFFLSWHTWVLTAVAYTGPRSIRSSIVKGAGMVQQQSISFHFFLSVCRMWMPQKKKMLASAQSIPHFWFNQS